MIAVRTLIRHLAPAASGPAELLRRLNAALCADNPTNLYVTLAHGVYDPADGGVVLALAVIQRRCCVAPTAALKRWRPSRA